MNIIGKIIGLIALVFIILILVNIKQVLPYISKIAFQGSATTSVTAITDELIKQIEAIYPAASLASYASGKANTIRVYTAIRSLTTPNAYDGSPQRPQISQIYLEKIGSRLSLISQSVSVPADKQGVYHFWLTDSQKISTSTKYKDFGTIRYSGSQMYVYNLGKDADNFSFKEYRYLKIINPKDLTIFSESVLQ